MITAGEADLAFRVRGLTGGDLKRDGYHAIEFEEVGDVIYKRLWPAGMDKSYRWSVSRRLNGCFRNAVQAGRGSTDTEVGEVRFVPVFCVIASSFPCDTMSPGQHLIGFSDAGSFDTPQLIDTAPGGRFFGKTDFIHLAYDFQSQGFDESELCLVKQSV